MNASPRSQPGRAWELLFNANFMLLWCAYGISAMGDNFADMAILKTQDALAEGVDITPLTARITFMFFVPFLVLGPFWGLLADRLPRRGLMMAADLIRAGIMFFFATLIAWTEPWGSWGAFLPVLLLGVFAALFSPSRAALLPTLVEPRQLVRANGIMGGLGIIGTMVGLKIGGYLAEHYEAVVSFRGTMLAYLASAVFLSFMRPPREARGHASGGGRPLARLLHGFYYARCHGRVMELLAVGALVWFCGALLNCVIPAVVHDVYGGDYQTIGTYRALLGVGFIIGAILITVLGEALRSEYAITWGLFGIGVSVAVLASSVFLPAGPGTLGLIGGAGIIGAGMFGLAVMASFNALLQRIVANRYRGRVFGVRDVCTTGSLLVATAVLGLPEHARVDRWVGYILVGVAVLTFVAGAVTLRVRVRRRRQYAPLTIAQNLNEFLCRFWWRYQRIGLPTVPREGAVIVTANHRCPADPLFLSAGVKYRPISFMVAAEYTNWPIIRSFMRLIECIPVQRDRHDTGATKQAIRHLRAGKALGIFIEGRIVPPGDVVEPKDGVAMLALKTGATVVPAYISGIKYRHGIVRGLLARHHATVRFGPPVDLNAFRGDSPGREQVRAATRKIFEAVEALAPPEGDFIDRGEPRTPDRPAGTATKLHDAAPSPADGA